MKKEEIFGSYPEYKCSTVPLMSRQAVAIHNTVFQNAERMQEESPNTSTLRQIKFPTSRIQDRICITGHIYLYTCIS